MTAPSKLPRWVTHTGENTALWIHSDGRVSCPQHGGYALQTALADCPMMLPDGIGTSRGSWSRAKMADHLEFRSAGLVLGCETCGHSPFGARCAATNETDGCELPAGHDGLHKAWMPPRFGSVSWGCFTCAGPGCACGAVL